MSISPTLFIGLGEFGSNLATLNHESFNLDYPDLIKLHASFTFNKDICFTTFDNKKVVGSIPLLKENTFRDNFKLLQDDSKLFASSLKSGIEYVIKDTGREDVVISDTVEINRKRKIIIYFSLGDNISSVSIQETIKVITDSRFSKSCEIFLVCINHDLLDEDENRAYACLRELDFYIRNISIVNSFTLLSKYGPNDWGGYKKDDVIPLTYFLSNKIISNQTNIITSPAIIDNVTNHGRRLIYNSFACTSLVYDKDKVWQKFCDHEKISYLTTLITNIDSVTFSRGVITGPINRFFANNSTASIRQELSTNEQNINLFIDPKEILFNQIEKEKPASVSELVNLLNTQDQQFSSNNWQSIVEAISYNIKNVEENYKKKITEEILSIVNNKDGLVKLRAALNLSLSQDDKSLDGVIIDQDVSFVNLINNQLRYFKELYERIPVDEREKDVKEIVFSEDKRSLQKDILNAESKISSIKQEIIQLDRSFSIDDELGENEQNRIENGYFTISGQRVNINSCIQDDLDYDKIYTPKNNSSVFKDFIDLRSYMSEDVESQGMIGSCVTNAITSAIEYISNRATKQFFPMSRLFLYYTARSYEKENGKITDEGCSIVKALLAAQSQGICLESAWPYYTEKVNAKPTAYAFVEAEKYKIDEFLKINPVLDDMLSCLSDGYPFIFGLKITDSFGKLGGIISTPSQEEERSDVHSKHAMLCVGYNLEKQVFIVRNSWGKEWGDKGYCYIPFDYMTNEKMIFDIITIRSVDEQLNKYISTKIWGDTLG